MSLSYSSIALAEPLQHAVADLGYETMTPIQEHAIPVVLAGQDVMGAARTGTGKTAAFSLPLLQRLLKHENSSASPARHPVRALVLLPTRELANQVAEQIALYAKYTNLRSTVVFGGVDIKPQIATLREGVEVLVATPGRLLDHIEGKSVILNQVEYVVLDEADRMLDIGFLPDLQRILSFLPPEGRTTLLFSATFSKEIRHLAESYLHNPITIEVAPPNATAATVDQHFFWLEDDDKRRAIERLFREHHLSQAFVFCNSKLGTARLARALTRDGLKVTAMHGDKTQEERIKSLEAFKSGEAQILVATDVAARGLDVKDVPAVFNYDVPFNPEDYIHRIGRTGRAGANGLAITLVTRGDRRHMDLLEQLLKKKVELEHLSAEEEAPRGHQNNGRRHWERDETGDSRDQAREHRRSTRGDRASGSSSSARPRGGYRKPQAPADPIFDQPYEASGAGEAAAWESRSRPAGTRNSPNIKPGKRKLAALFKQPLASEESH